MGRSHTAFRLSGIRARDDAAESDEAMASNDNKKKARRLQQKNPGMKYTEALRRVEAGAGGDLIHFGISLEDGRDVFFDFSRQSTTGPTILMDEWHDLTPSGKTWMDLEAPARETRDDPASVSVHGTIKSTAETRADLSGTLNRLTPRGRAPWPLHVGDDLSDWTPAVLFPLENDGNLAVCGPSNAGHTRTLHALARSALREGWNVSVVGTKADEFRDLRERHPQRVSALPGGRFVSEEEGRAFVEGTTPGTAREPRLVIIDNGDYFFDSVPKRMGEEWVGALESLMTHPYTAVALQSTFLNRKLIPARIIRHLNARLLLGHSAKHMQGVVFRDVVPQETLDAFDFSQPTWTGTAADRARGVLWDGERLQHVHVAGLDGQAPMMDFKPKEPLTPLRDLRLQDGAKVVDVEPTEEMRREWERLHSEAVEVADGRTPLFAGRTVGDVTSQSVFLDFSALGEETAGVTDDFLWAGHCGTEEQAREAYRLLGSPGDEGRFIAIVMRLKPPHQLFLTKRDSGWTQIVQIDPDSLAAMEEYERQEKRRLEE